MTVNSYVTVKYMKLLALDLEMNQPSGKIIQIGACVGDLEAGTILATFSVFVNPYEQLAERITDLTGITQKQVDHGVSLLDAYLLLKQFHAQHGCFMNPVEWNGGDSILLKKQLKDEYPDFENFYDWCFGRRYLDAKTLYQSYRVINGKPAAGGLARAMTKFGLAFKGAKHDARDDAVNTFRIFHKLVQYFKEETV